MDRSVRSSSAPLSGRTMIDGISALHTSVNGANEKSMLPRSPGYFPSDNSLARLEFQDCKRSTDQLKELARTTPPDEMATKPTFTERKATADLTRSDSGRRRRIREQIGGGGSHPQTPLKRLFRLNRSATTSDLSGESRPRGSMEVASKHSSGGRKYLKIAINPKMYDLENPSTYKVNFEDLSAKGKSHKWIYRKSRADLDPDPGNEGGHISHISGENDDQGKEVTDLNLNLGSDRYDPARAVTNPASKGYSPSKGIPKVPEHGLQDFAAATLATAQARARAASSGCLFRSPERPGTQRESPIRKHGHHVARRRTSSKGPYSVPIRFHLRPQRTSLPKTPRTSLDEPATGKDSALVAVKGTAAQSSSSSPVSPVSPIESSPAKSGRSFIDECQSDAESGQIMNAQRAEFIHGQGAYAYHPSSSCQPPKPGPAPTRALPSLPEGCNDGATPKSTTGKLSENKNVLPSESPAGCGSSPKQQQKHPPESPPKKGHRYRLSPVKNNVPSESRILKPSPTFTEVFPQPPTSNTLLARESSDPISPRTRNPDRELDGSTLVTTGRCLELSTSSSNSNNANGVIPRPVTDDRKTVNGVDGPSSSAQECVNHSVQRSKDADKDNLYIPWHESRVDRVKALKLRDVERLRARQNSAEVQRRDDGDQTSQAPGKERDQNHPDTKLASQPSPAQSNKRLDSGKSEKRNKGSLVSTKNDFSPIIVVAEQRPCPAAAVNDPQYPYPSLNDNNNDCSTAGPTTNGHQLHPNHHDEHTYPSRSHTVKPNSILHPPPPPNHQQHPSASSSSYRPLSPPVQTNSYHPPLTNPPSDISTRLEARLAAMEKKNILLERMFLAVIDASSGFSSAFAGRGSGYL
ncbi:MAG: hypothetical protein Q9199_006529, partial [Rusavskia elegans]